MDAIAEIDPPVKGVVIACQECGANHFYEWELLRDNLDQMLRTGEPRMHEPAFDIQEEEYIQWDYGKICDLVGGGKTADAEATCCSSCASCSTGK